jgi:hypothetical protein
VIESRTRVYTPEELAMISKAIEQKAPHLKVCPLCQTNNWGIVGGVLFIPLQGRSPSGSLVMATTNNIPLLPIICKTCGNAVFLAIYQLGLEPLFGIGSAKPIEDLPAEAS